MGPLGLSYRCHHTESRPSVVGTDYTRNYTLRAVVCGCGVTMTAGHFNDPEYWRQKADEARAVARQLLNPNSKEMMMRIAVCL